MDDITTTGQSYRFSHIHKGEDYDESFRCLPHRAMIWQIEKRALQTIVSKYFREKRPHLLDFACGTGRIIGLLRPWVESATGIDVSDSMLDVARQNTEDADFVVGDLTREPVLANRKFDLISAFRFFPNAEPELRGEVIGSLAHHLDKDGILVFNNHMNSDSLQRKIGRLLGVKETHGMTEDEVISLVESVGLKIVDKYPIGILPLTDKRMPRRSGSYIQYLDRALTAIPGATRLSQNIIYVCRQEEFQNRAQRTE